MDRWMDKEDVVHIYNGILLSHKKSEIMPSAATMDRTRESHTKWSESEAERQTAYDVAYM